jgi:two-component system, NtrC family, nitrogen regulation response regulator GlnG
MEPRTSKDATSAALDTWIEARRGARGDVAGPETVPVLSILYHPDLARVGERLVLSDLASSPGVLLSRTGPDFVGASRDAGAPLADRNLSRNPIRLSALEDGGVRVELGECRTRVAVRGAPLDGAVDLTASEVRRGVTLELGGRVVLLLHEAVATRTTGVFITVADDAVSADLLGTSEAMRRLRQDIRRVADLDVPVLARGETGSGKELVARAIHRAGRRCDAPFVAVNLGAVSAQIAVAELFGHEKGAFTGAERKRPGYFQQAHGGTLFLDEIGEAPPEIQVALLRALETGEVLPVGAHQPQKVDVRVVAATDADLEAEIRDGHFRAPLLHRLSAYEIWVPPLRERAEDVGLLLVRFLREALEETREAHRLTDPPSTGELWFPASLVARLVDHEWPGNVRQLRNVVRQIVIGSRGLRRAAPGAAVERQLRAVDRFPPASLGDAGVSLPREAEAPTVPPPSAPPPEARRRPADVAERELEGALRASRWDFARAASLLGISRTSVYALVEESPRFRTASDLGAAEITQAFHACDGDLASMVERLEVSERALKRRLRDLGLVERSPGPR